MGSYFEIGNTIIEALLALEKKSFHQTLFVVNKQGILIGTLTDGDIRRYLINGGQLIDDVEYAIHRNFVYVKQGDSALIAKLKEFRAKNLKVVPLLDKFGHIVDIYDLINYKSYLPIDVVLMAGGKGERLRPLTEKTPKPLLLVGDKCIIDYNIDRLISYGIEHISVTCNYLKEQLYEHFEKPRLGVKINCVTEPNFLGTIGAIKFVETFYNDTVLVMNSDLFTDVDYEDFYLHFKEHNADMSVAAVPYNVSIPFGILDLDGRNIKGLLEKPKYNYYANAGIYLFKKSAIAEIPKDTFFNATDFIEKLIAQGKKVVRYPLNGTWIDIGQHVDLVKAQELVKHLKKYSNENV